MSKQRTTPGVHPNCHIEGFTTEEQEIIRRLSNEWFVTRNGGTLKVAGSAYRYILIKPCDNYSMMFNIEREIICAFSAYAKFEPRTLDAFSMANAELSDLRIEKVVRVLISNDPEIEPRIGRLLKSDPEQPIVVPFTYEELGKGGDPYFIRNRFRQHFYSRNLFAFLSPLKSDLFFYGRSQLVNGHIQKSMFAA